MGRIGSGVRVSVSFLQNTRRVLSYDVLRQQKTGVMTKGLCPGGEGLTSSPAYNVEPVTDTSSSFCENNERRTPQLDACRRPSRLCFSQFATRTVDNTVDLYAANRPESRFLPIPPAFDPPVRGGGSRWNIAIPFGTEKLE